MVKVSVKHNKIFTCLFFFKYNIAANSVTRCAPILTHNLGRFGKPKRAFILKLEFFGAVKYGAALREICIISILYNAVISFKRILQICVMDLCNLLKAYNIRHNRGHVFNYETRAVTPALFAYIGGADAAHIGTHNGYLVRLRL